MFASKFIINVTRRSSFSSTTKMVLRRSNNIKHVNYFGTTIDGETPPKTAIVMLNMGGPNDLDETGPFLSNLFNDGEIIQLGPLQNYLGPWIAHRRTPKVRKQYDEIGGRSPIRIWTEKQGQGMVEILDKISPETAPHKHYIMFRYAAPLTEETLLQMKADGVTRAIAFSQYPHWSCTTSGSSMNHLWRELKRLNMGDDFEWSLIDRWPLHDGFLNAVKKRITIGLEQFDESGHDTTASLLSFTFFHILQKENQHVYEKLRTEADVLFNEFKSTSNKIFTYDHVNRLEYTKAVLKETLRVDTPGPIIARETSKSDTLPNGVRIPQGTSLWIAMALLHSDKNKWKNVDKFEPERFLKAGGGHSQTGQYIPFSMGSRNCVGQRFALIEASILLAYIVHSYDMQIVEGRKLIRETAIVNRPKNGVHVVLHKRS